MKRRSKKVGREKGTLHPIDATLAVSLRIGAQIIGRKAKVVKGNRGTWPLALLTTVMHEMEQHYLKDIPGARAGEDHEIGLEACGVMDLIGAVVETIWPEEMRALVEGCEDRPPAGLEGVRIDEATLEFLGEAGPPPVDVSGWLEQKVAERSRVVTVDRSGSGTEAYVLMRQCSAGEEQVTAVAVRAVGEEAVQICTIRGTGFTPEGGLKGGIAGGAMILGDQGGENEELFAEMEDGEARKESVAWNDEVAELCTNGTLAQALALAERMVEGKDTRLQGMAATVPAWMVPPTRPTRAKLRRHAMRAREAEPTDGIFHQWKLPAGPQKEGGGGAARQKEQGQNTEEEGGSRRKPAAHGVSGHYKHQAYGEKGRKRRVIYVSPYWRGRDKEEAKAWEWILPQWEVSGIPAGVGPRE